MTTKIPEKLWYVSKGPGQLAYLTSFGTDAPFRKRAQTGLDWANYQYHGQPKPDNKGVTIDNAPITGFVIADWSERSVTNNKLMQIEDPRGFIVELPIKNFFDLIKNATIIKGIVGDACIWGKEGKNLALIPVNSVLHNNIVHETLHLTKQVKDLMPGDVFKFTNEATEYMYYGCAVLQYKVDIIKTAYNCGITVKSPITEDIIESHNFDGKIQEAVVQRFLGNCSTNNELDLVNPERTCILIRSDAAPDRNAITFVATGRVTKYYNNSGPKKPYILADPNSFVMKSVKFLLKGRDIKYSWDITSLQWKD